MIDVRPIGPDADDQYTAFLDRVSTDSPEVLAYHYPLYRRMLVGIEVGQPMYLGAFEGDRMIGALPGFVKESAHGACYCSLPYFGPNAGVITGETGARSAAIHRELIGSALARLGAHARPLTASFYSPFLADGWELYRPALDGAIEVDKQTQYLELQALEPFDAKVAYDIRKARKAGVAISTDVTDEKLRGLYEIYAGNCREFGIPQKPFAAIAALVEGGARGLSRLYFAHHESGLIGALLVLWSKQTASYYVPCTKGSARALQPNTLLIDHAIGDARAAGLKYWNWESSPPDRAGVFDFKKKWGSRLSAYKIFVKRFCAESTLAEIGAEQLERSFPYFFVYPFARLAA